MIEEKREKIDFIELIKLTKENLKKIIIILLVFSIVGVIYSNCFVVPLYKTTSTILIDQTSTAISDLVNNNELTKEVSQELNMDYLTIKKSIDVIYTKNAKTIQIYVNYKDNNISYNIAKTYIEILETTLNTYYSVEQFDLVIEPSVADNPNGINHLANILKFMLLGIIISMIYVLILKFKNGITSGNEIEQLGIKYLGNDNIEFDRTLINIELNKNVRNPKIIFIAGVNNDTQLLNKISLSYKDKHLLLIDGTFIDSKDNNCDVIKAVDLGITKENLSSKQTLEKINHLKDSYDIIFIKGNELLNDITSTIWSNMSDVIVLAIKYRKTKQKDLILCKTYIEDVSGKIIGAILEK